MTKKLTKNDSMSIKQQRFEVAASAFKALLYRRDLYQSYFHAWNWRNQTTTNVQADMAWEKWAKITDTDQWVSKAFLWAATDISDSIWRTLDNDWLKYVQEYLKK